VKQNKTLTRNGSDIADKTPKYNNPSVGCYVDESCGSADNCNERTIEFAQGYGFDAGEEIEDDEDRSQNLSEIADSAVSFLNELETRSFMSWTFEDNSLFLIADVDTAKDDVGFVSHSESNHTDECDPDDASYPAADYRGEWLHVSDHGNATLYVRGDDGKDVEIWSVV
jgi:hypothetical protein